MLRALLRDINVYHARGPVWYSSVRRSINMVAVIIQQLSAVEDKPAAASYSTLL